GIDRRRRRRGAGMVRRAGEIADLAFGGDWRGDELALWAAVMALRGCAGLQIHLGPARACDRPFVLAPELVVLQSAACAHLQLGRRLRHDPGVDALQPVVEEAELVGAAFLAVKRVEVRAGVDPQLLVLARRLRERFGVAAQMQPDAGPVADA